MTPEQQRELIAIKAAIYDALILRHPGHGTQKVHGNRYGSYGAAKESLRRLKEDKAAREKYKQTARKRNEATINSKTPEYHAAKKELDQAMASMGNTPESEWGELDREFVNDIRGKVQEEAELSALAQSMGYTPGKMTTQDWATVSNKVRQQANDELKYAFESGRLSAGEKLRGQKDVWRQVGGQAVLTRSGRSRREAQELTNRLNRETRLQADEHMGQTLTRFGYSADTIRNLDYTQRRRLIAEIGHGQLQSSAISGVPISERRRVVSSVSDSSRLAARSQAMNPRAAKGMERWTYYEQAALRAGREPDLMPDYLMDIRDMPDYVRYPGGRREEIDF